MYNCLSDKEQAKALKFRTKHWKKCKADYYYKVLPTGIGEGVIIVCNGCNKEKDITDYSKW